MRSLGFEVADEVERCANLFGVKLPAGMDPEACRQHLARQQIHVAVRGNAVRVSPHVYNDEHDWRCSRMRSRSGCRIKRFELWRDLHPQEWGPTKGGPQAAR